MDRQDSNLPDHDPAASSFPSVQRGERVVGAVARLVTQQRDDAAREALMTVRRALRQGVTISELVTELDHLTSGTVAATLEALADLTNQAGDR